MRFFFGQERPWSPRTKTSLCWKKLSNLTWKNRSVWRGRGDGELCLSNYQGRGGPLVTNLSGKLAGRGEELTSYRVLELHCNEEKVGGCMLPFVTHCDFN